ncbi:MAG TPA: hypothetical protein PLR30_07415, partial [Saprospiraceae bacterium]|nr:hypothetical protein [Saprospiraceae bacterium]
DKTWSLSLPKGRKNASPTHTPPLRMRRGRRVEDGLAVSPSTGSGTGIISIIIKLSALSVVSQPADQVLDYGYQFTLQGHYSNHIAVNCRPTHFERIRTKR